MSNLHHILKLISRSDLPTPQVDYKFHPERTWRFPFAWPDQKIALYYVRDARELMLGKLNEAQALGWTVILVDENMTTSGRVIHYLKRAFALKGDSHDNEKQKVFASQGC